MRIATAGNTVVPALLTLERLGFTVTLTAAPEALCVAKRGDDEYMADDPVAVLGLVKLVEVRGPEWRASDQEIDGTLRKYGLDG